MAKAPSRTKTVKPSVDISSIVPPIATAGGSLVVSASSGVQATVLPAAKWAGVIELVKSQIDCYVLDDGERVISINGAVKALAGLETGHGRLDKYIGINALKGYIDSAAVMENLVEFSISGNNFGNGRGLTTDQFEEILRAFITAMTEGASFTPHQLKMAHRCAMISSGLARVGIVALVDEATGYQKVRSDDELQIRLKAYIAKELRPWESTFPEELWHQFGRLTGWKDSITNRPRWWGKLVGWLIYDTLPEEVATYLRQNRPAPGIRWHQQLTENYGVRMLVTRCIEVYTLASQCKDIQELSEKVALKYGRKPLQLSLSELMREERPVALTRRMARVNRERAREEEFARVLASRGSGLIVEVTESDMLQLTGPVVEQPASLSEAPVERQLTLIPNDPVASNDSDAVPPVDEQSKPVDFETAHERLAVGRSTRRA